MPLLYLLFVAVDRIVLFVQELPPTQQSTFFSILTTVRENEGLGQHLLVSFLQFYNTNPGAFVNAAATVEETEAAGLRNEQVELQQLALSALGAILQVVEDANLALLPAVVDRRWITNINEIIHNDDDDEAGEVVSELTGPNEN
jgi:hypothetical protein